MKKLFLLLTLFVASCSPQAYTLLLETRQPSKSGMDLGGKTAAVVYLETDNPADTLFNNFFADGLSQRLDSFMEGSSVFSMKKFSGADYSSKDTLVNLIMDTESDVVMLLDTPEFIEKDGKTYHASKMFVYDALDKSDVVRIFADTTAFTNAEDEKMVSSDAQFSAYNWASVFVPEWKKEQFTILYFDDEDWIKGVSLADSLKWQDALDVWMKIASDSKSEMQSSCAAYNIALGAYFLSNYDLALQWLDMSDKLYPISLNSGLRKRILEKK